MIGASFNKIVGDALQRMVLKNGSPEEAATEIMTKYAEAVTQIQ